MIRPRRRPPLAALVLSGILGLAAPGFAQPVPAPQASPSPPPAAGQAAPARAPRRVFVQDLREPDALTRAGRRLLDRTIDFLPSLLAAILVMAGFYLFYRLVARLLHGLLRRTRADPAVQEIGLRLTRFVLLAFGLVMAASQLGFAVGSVLAGLGIAGLAVGLAAQDSLANLVGGLTILWDRPFHIGDNVTVAGTFGRVQAIGLRATTILTVRREEAIIPNKQVINELILNHTRHGQLRLAVPVGIGYGDDLRRARQVLLAAVEGHPRVLPDPAPKVVVTALAESAVTLELRVFLRNPHDEREAFFELLELVKVTLDEAGIEIPFPQRTLHLADRDLLEGALPPRGSLGRRERDGGHNLDREGADVAGWEEVDH